ncbi:MAG: S8 family serine peptidase [Deltaproteobacteria bacterium]|nr:S8 family serine peptidase [Deltaproteobacteria bacterium]
MRRVVVGLGCLVLVAGLGCFEVDPPDEPEGDANGVIAGTILVGQASGASARDPSKVKAARVDVAAASAPAAARAPALHVSARLDDPKPEIEFINGQAIVFSERGRFDQVTIARALQRMRVAAGVDDKIEFRVATCTGKGMLCKIELIDNDGYVDADRTTDVVAALHKARLPGIKNVVRNVIHTGMRVPNDPFTNLQWHYDAIKLPPAWDITIGSPDLVVAVVDSGVFHGNPDLREKLARDPNNANQFVEMDFVDASISLDGDGLDLDAEDPGDNLFGTDAEEDSFHGTHVAGTIGAETDNRRGVAGILWEAQIVPVRVLGQALSGDFFAILDGLLWAVGDPESDAPPNQRPAKIVNLSLGGPAGADTNEVWEGVITFILDDPENLFGDPVLICAAGNDGLDARSVVPANIPRMITVGATRFDGLRADYSNFGSAVDVMAPGGQFGQDQNNDGNEDAIMSTWEGDVKLEQGTSMAAPHVSGVAGLLAAAKPNLTHDLIHDLLKNTANQQLRCNEGCGNGLVDAVQALLIAEVELDPAPRLALDRERLVFPTGITSLELRVLNLGNVAAPFTVEFGDGDAALFTVTPTSGTVASAGNVIVEIGLDRGAAVEGAVELKFVSTGETPVREIIAVVLFQDNPLRPTRNLDTVEVAAFSRDDGGDLVQAGKTLATRSAGFAYEITGLKAGIYEIYAVGDDNQDLIFDSQVESFGAFPLADGIKPVVLEANDSRVDGIDFVVALQSSFSLDNGVGAPCTDASSAVDCAGMDFAPDAACIDTFFEGYCSRVCGEDNECGANGICDVLDCDGTPCALCLQRCVSDSQCRDGYECDRFGTCTPAGFTP